MTLTANRVERHPNAPITTPERIVVRTTYGPITNEVTEDAGHVRSFHAQLGRVLDEAEGTPNRTETDAAALDQIAGLLGLYTTNPSNNPVEELLNSIIGNVQQTGRATNVPEGA